MVALRLVPDPDPAWFQRAGRPELSKSREAWCSDCRQYKPRADFWNSASRSTGVQTYCRACMAVRVDRWQTAHPDERRVQSRRATLRWRAKNPDRVKARKRRYYEAHRERILAAQRARYAAMKATPS